MEQTLSQGLFSDVQFSFQLTMTTNLSEIGPDKSLNVILHYSKSERIRYVSPI